MSGCGGLALICISIVVNVDGGEAGTCFLNLDTSSSRGLFFLGGGRGGGASYRYAKPAPSVYLQVLIFFAIVFCFLSCQFNLLCEAQPIISQVCCPTGTLERISVKSWSSF